MQIRDYLWLQVSAIESVEIPKLVRRNSLEAANKHIEKPKVMDRIFTSEEILHALGCNEDGDAWIFVEQYRGKLSFDRVWILSTG